VIVSAASDPLCALLDSRFSEGVSNAVVLETSSGALEAMLSFIYRGATSTSLDNIADVLHLAHMYSLTDLVDKIVETLPTVWNVATAVSVLSECDFLGLDSLESACERYIAVNFEEAAGCNMFPHISAAQFGRLLKNPNLFVQCEESILLAMLSWRQAQPGRDAFFEVLMQHINFPCMALQSLSTTVLLGTMKVLQRVSGLSNGSLVTLRQSSRPRMQCMYLMDIQVAPEFKSFKMGLPLWLLEVMVVAVHRINFKLMGYLSQIPVSYSFQTSEIIAC